MCTLLSGTGNSSNMSRTDCRLSVLKKRYKPTCECLHCKGHNRSYIGLVSTNTVVLASSSPSNTLSN